MWHTSELNNNPINGRITRTKKLLEAFFKGKCWAEHQAISSITEKIEYLIRKLFGRIYWTLFSGISRRSWLLLSMLKISSLNLSWLLISYNQYALKTNDDSAIWKVWKTGCSGALYFANGDEAIAKDHLMKSSTSAINRTPNLNAGRARRSEFDFHFLIQVTDSMNSIGRSINTACNCLVSEAGSVFSLSNAAEAGAPIKRYEGAASGVIACYGSLRTASLTLTSWGSIEGQGCLPQCLPPRRIPPSFLLRKKMATKRRSSG